MLLSNELRTEFNQIMKSECITAVQLKRINKIIAIGKQAQQTQTNDLIKHRNLNQNLNDFLKYKNLQTDFLQWCKNKNDNKPINQKQNEN